MTLWSDRELFALLGGVFGLLLVVTAAAWVLRATAGEGTRALADEVWARTRSSWPVALLVSLALVTGEMGTILLFFFLSMLALREFLTLAPTRASDHRTMASTFFVIAPLQYAMVGTQSYGFSSVLIPVYAFLFIPSMNAMASDPERFLERTATVQWGLMVCVYCLSHGPALLWLRIPGYEGENAKLLLFCIVVAQVSDFFQFVFGKLLGRRKIAPGISPNQTWEGFLGGLLSATAAGAALWWATPFSPGVAGLMALVIGLMGFAGGLTMSAIERDRGVKGFGTLLAGHGRILDRVGSLCFSMPIFFHLTRFACARGT